MDKIAFYIKQRALFFYSFITLVIVGLVFLIITGKTDSFLFFNKYHFTWLDVFMEYYTNVGNGVFAICLGICCFFLWKKRALGLTIFYSFLSSGIMVQLVKNIHDSHRPQLFFSELPGGFAAYKQFFIDGIDFAHNNSFPSGHTATAFATATVCTLMIENKKLQIPFFLVAVLVGFSRIYLGQHFLLDVLVGAFIGVICGVACVHLANKYSKSVMFGTFKTKA